MSFLRILCFNIHGGRSLGGERDLNRINALMDEYKIDIGVFQEMETRGSKGGSRNDISILAGASRPHYLPGPSLQDGTGWYGNLIISRYPILRGLVHNLETKIEYEPRCAVDALIETPLGKIRLIGTHLSLASWERYSEAKNLMRLVDQVQEAEKKPLLLMGDLNEWRKNSRLLKHLDELLTPLPCQPTFPSFLPVFKLDRVWHDAQRFNITARTLSSKSIKKLSDHLPVIVEISN